MFRMDGVSKINLGEGVPLNTNATNIFLSAGKNGKTKANSGPVIHLSDPDRPAGVGVHINTTLSIASSKKIKLLFILNFLLSVICMVISCSIAFYYWNEIIAMRRQLDTLKDQFLIQNLNQNEAKLQPSPLVSERRSYSKGIDFEIPKFSGVKVEISPNIKKYFVEDLGEDILLVDSSKKNPSTDKTPIYDLSVFQKDLLIAHFNGGIRETNLGTTSIMGPWVHDPGVSTKNSEDKIELHNNYVTIKEGGLYLVYAQVVYLTKAPNCYFIWARQTGRDPRLLSTCATGDDSSSRPLEKSQISCYAQTITRLYKGDIVNIAQREQNRTVWLRPGYSYFGFVKLSS